jgi:DNA polymerase III delta prime subunit
MDWLQGISQGFGMAFASLAIYMWYCFVSQNDYLSSFLPGGYKKFYHLRKSTTTFDDIIGHNLIKKDLKQTLDGKSPVKGFIFSGVSGTGKTMMARAIASYAEDKVFAEIYADTLDTDIVLRTIDHLIANHSPIVIYIDECHKMLSRFSNYFLRKLDGFDVLDNVLFVCSTNESFTRENPLIRTGRFKHYTFEAPSYECRKLWFQKYRPDDNIDILLTNSEGLSYADLTNTPTELSASKILTSNFGFMTEMKTFTEEQLRRIAYHEIGHFMMALCCKNSSDPLMCSLENTNHIGGVNIIKQSTIYTFEQLEAQLIVLLGGRIAEWYLTGMTSTLFNDDADKIETVLKAIEKNRMITNFSYRFHDDYITHLESEMKTYYSSINIDLFEQLTDILIQRRIIKVNDVAHLITDHLHTFTPKPFVPDISKSKKLTKSS